MKTLYLSIIVISLILVGASNSSTAHIEIPQIFTSQSNFTDGDIIPITGYGLPNSKINIFLANNHGNIQNSTQVKSNSTGYFNTSLGIPSHVVGGAWALFATDGEGNFAMQLMVNFHGSSTPPFNFPSGLPPLKQFKLGIKPSYVQCRSDLDLVIKSEDGSPACVSIETGKKLVLRGWATTFGTGMIVNDYTISCNTAYPRSDSGIAVLYMPTNSVGKVCVRYHNLNNVPTIVGDRIFDANNIANNASDVTTWASTNTLQGNDNATIVYSIKTGNQTGLYGLTIFCSGMPLAVGYDDKSNFTLNDFPWEKSQTINCPMMTYQYQIDSLSGIGVKYIPYP